MRKLIYILIVLLVIGCSVTIAYTKNSEGTTIGKKSGNKSVPLDSINDKNID